MHIRGDIVTLLWFLYALLQTGRIMVWWCPSVRVSVPPSIHPSQFSALFSYMLWDIKLKFCASLYFDARKIKFEYHQFPSIFAGVMPLLNFTLLQICSFLHISYTCFDILSWNFAYDFVLLYFRSSLCVVNLRQFLLELSPFWNLEYWKYTVFHTFLLQALTYWAEIFRMTVLLYYSSSLSIINLCQFLWELCPFWNLEYWKYTVFRTFLLHALTYRAKILHMTLLVPYRLAGGTLSLLAVCQSVCQYVRPSHFSFPDFSLL